MIFLRILIVAIKVYKIYKIYKCTFFTYFNRLIMSLRRGASFINVLPHNIGILRNSSHNIEKAKIKMRKEKLLQNLNEKNILKKLRRRFINEFLDLIILNRVESVPYINGYAIIEYIFQKFNILVSSGSIYSTLYAMEREGLIEGVWKGRKRIYSITPEGREIIKTVENKSIL